MELKSNNTRIQMFLRIKKYCFREEGRRLFNAYLNNPFRNEDSFRDNTTVHKGNVSY